MRFLSSLCLFCVWVGLPISDSLSIVASRRHQQQSVLSAETESALHRSSAFSDIQLYLANANANANRDAAFIAVHVDGDKADEKLVSAWKGNLEDTRKLLGTADLDVKTNQKSVKGFTYTVDSKYGRVVAASGPVLMKWEQSNPSLAAHKFCDLAWYVEPTTPAPKIRPGEFHTGHIIGANLGGDNQDPINFFPHAAYSNTYGGVWYRMERIARQGANLLYTINKACILTLDITFEYGATTTGYSKALAAATYIPTWGTFGVITSTDCANAYAKVSGMAKGKYALAFTYWVKNMKVSGSTAKFSYNWWNAYDKANDEADALLFPETDD